MHEQMALPGFSSTPTDQWPQAKPQDMKISEFLRRGSPAHDRVRDYLKDRLEYSERKMATFYSRWRVGESKVQAYIDLPQYEKILQDMNNNKKPPQIVSISIPHSYATISTIVTYHLHTFCGRKPIFQVSSNKVEMLEKARNMESKLQYDADHNRIIKHIYKFLMSSQIYGVGIMRVGWENRSAMRTERKMQPKWNLFGLSIGQKLFSERQKKLVYSGAELSTIDPFMFFPDPRVPMHEVARQGEFAWWRNFVGKHELKRKEFEGTYFQIDQVSDKLPRAATGDGDNSQRGLLSSGDSTAGYFDRTPERSKMTPYYQEDQGTIIIIPKELGLGESTEPQRWLFTMLNKDTIVQAQPFDADHDRHPVAVTEPYTLGQSFGSPSMVDFLGPIQDTISWLVNSHIFNIRAALNNMFVVDPSMVEIDDLKNPEPGKIIRLKRAAYGQDVRSILNQLNVADVTRGHIGDLEMFIRISQQLSSVNDNLLGMQDTSGRKTATEVRTSGEAAGSRLAAQARLISAQGLVDVAEMMAMNNMQYVDDQFYFEVLGMKGQANPIKVTPDQFSGDFYYPIHDGTLPLDRVAMLDVWKEVFIAVSKDPQLRQEFSVPEIFSYIAELGGAKNIDQFKVNPAMPTGQPQLAQATPMPDDQMQSQIQAGNVVPLNMLARSNPF